MVLVQSSKLSLPPSLPPTKSILFEPNSLSLALMHTDSSVSLFPCLSFPSPPLPPKPQTLVPSPSSSSSFLLIHQDPIPKVLFLVASPYRGGSQILLRFYLLQKDNIFCKPQVVCNQKVKLRSVRCRQDSGEGGACFVAFKREEVEVLKPTTSKAVSIQALSHKKFVILDSMGDLHILCLSAPVIGSNFMAHMRRLPHSMKVQKLAVLPDISLKMQTFWVSDGLHSVHTITLSDMGAAVNSNNEDETQEKLIQITVIQAIFSAEKIQDLIPLGANGILILGQGNIYSYAIP